MFDESISPIFLRDLNQNLDAITNNSERMKKGFSVIVNDKDEVIGGRHNGELEMFQPIKHLSGERKSELYKLRVLSQLLFKSWSCGKGIAIAARFRIWS